MRQMASMIFLTDTEKGINNCWKKVIRTGVDLRSFPGAGGCMVVEKREGSVQQIPSSHCTASNLLPLIPNYSQHIVFYLETNNPTKTMTTAHDFSPPSPTWDFCVWDWIQSGVGYLVKEPCEPLSISSIKVTQPIWLRRKKAFLSAQPGYHNITCATWETKPKHRWEVLVFSWWF